MTRVRAARYGWQIVSVNKVGHESRHSQVFTSREAAMDALPVYRKTYPSAFIKTIK